MFNVAKLSVFMFNVAMLSVFMFNVAMLSVVLLNVAILNVVAPSSTRQTPKGQIHLLFKPVKVSSVVNFIKLLSDKIFKTLTRKARAFLSNRHSFKDKGALDQCIPTSSRENTLAYWCQKVNY